jgi:hypothetical protein
MHLGRREAVAGCFKPVASCQHLAVRNCSRFVTMLVQGPKPATCFAHGVRKIENSNALSKQGVNQPKKTRSSFSCLATTTDDTSHSSSSSLKSILNREEIEERIKRAANFITTSEKLIPFDPSSTNLGLVIWQAIRDIPAEHRPQLINRLSSG